VGVAFLDVGVYVTSLRTLKNVMLIGDAVKGVWLVAFQVCYPFLFYCNSVSAHKLFFLRRRIHSN